MNYTLNGSLEALALYEIRVELLLQVSHVDANNELVLERQVLGQQGIRSTNHALVDNGDELVQSLLVHLALLVSGSGILATQNWILKFPLEFLPKKIRK